MAKSVLICDDAAFMRVMIKDILTKNGYDVAGEAENGLKAVEKYNETKPDLVMMDITMPEMDGIQTMRYLKQRVDFVNTPIVALTANAISGMKEMYLREGFDDYLSKPIDQVKLNEILRKYLLKDGGNDNDKGTGI